MKHNKLLLLALIVFFVSIIAINTSFAAGNETITKFKSYQVEKFNTKIVDVEEASIRDSNHKKDKYYYKFSIKDKFKNKYKIKSIKIKYGNDYGYYKYKTYNVKNKLNFTLKPSNGYYSKLIINFHTKSKIKNVSVDFVSKNTRGKWKSLTRLYGKKANIVLREKGYSEYWGMGSSTITSQKFKITTKNPRYKLKSVKSFYFSAGGIEMVNTYNGNWKNSLTVQINEKYSGISLDAFKVYYY